jgi:hypothetical protein
MLALMDLYSTQVIKEKWTGSVQSELDLTYFYVFYTHILTKSLLAKYNCICLMMTACGRNRL